MEALVADWGAEILLSLIIAGLTGWFKFKEKQNEKRIEEYKILVEKERVDKTKVMIDIALEPIYAKLEDLRQWMIKLQNSHKNDMSLIVDSYRYRLMVLCGDILNKGYMYQYEYDQINKMYGIYSSLGGNGTAKDYYDRVMQNCEIKPNPPEM